MQTYQDASGKKYSFEITGYEVRELRKAGLSLANEDKIAEAHDDTEILGQVMLVLCAGEIKNFDVSEEQFLRNLKQDAIESARNALLEAIYNYIPKSEADLMREKITATKKISKAIQSEAMKEVNKTLMQVISSDSAVSSGVPQSNAEES